MNAGFFKRAFSTLLDIVLVITVVAGSYLLLGQRVIQNQIPNFAIVYQNYQEVVEAYNTDLANAKEDYNVALTLAGEDEDLQAQALADYTSIVDRLNAQNQLDIAPFNTPVLKYILNSVYFFVIGYLLLTGIYTLAMGGKTVGRRMLGVELAGAVNPVSILLHDVVLKAFVPLFLMIVNLGLGLMVAAIGLMVDALLINGRRQNGTLRDMILKIRVVNAGTAERIQTYRPNPPKQVLSE